MAEPAAVPDTTGTPVEPVHWQARLARSPEFCYTEVDGTPVLVRPRDFNVVTLTPTWASIWATLDGRPVRDALQADPTSLDPVDARNLIEVLRRLKAKEVIRDVNPDDPSPGGPNSIEPNPIDLAPGGPEAGVQTHLDKRVILIIRGSFVRHGKLAVLTVDPTEVGTVAVVVSEAANATMLQVRRRLRKRRIDRIHVTDTRHPTVSESALHRFAALVEAVVDRTVLFRPGLVDLLAGIAERATAPVSPDLET